MGDLDFLNNGGGFDADSVEPMGSYELLPVGWYPVKVDRAELKDTSTGGKMIKFMLTVVDGKHKNRKVFTNINIVNKSKKAEEIGQARLAALCKAAGVNKLNDTKVFLGKIVDARIVVDKGGNGYDPDNDAQTFDKVGSRSAQAVDSPAAQPAPAKAGGEAKRPWD